MENNKCDGYKTTNPQAFQMEWRHMQILWQENLNVINHQNLTPPYQTCKNF
jgi:hypothetical protein